MDKIMEQIDLADLDTSAACDEGAELELVHPRTQVGLGMFITMYGVDSKIWRRALSDVGERRARKRGTPSLDEVRAQNIEILARCTRSWRGIRVDGGEPPCTYENARALYTRFPWITDQVDAFAGDRGNYISD